MTYSDNTENDGVSHFSLFEGDLLNCGFAKIGIGSRTPLDLIKRMVLIVGLTWGPMALLSIPMTLALPANAPAGQNFFYDFAAYAQFFFGIPLYIIAERVCGASIRNAARDFEESGVVAPEDKPKLREIEKGVELARKRIGPELICISIAFYFGFMALSPELTSTDPNMVTWHTYPLANPGWLTHWYTPAGLFATIFALPVQTYIWVRWVWKIVLWYWYLRRLSQFKLVLVASHPDHTGGIGFLSEVQAKFALVILAGGISGVVATVGYKIAIEHAPINIPPVWGLVFGFAIGAPILFLAPLLLFTKQLARTKKRAIAHFRDKAMASAVKLETQFFHSDLTQDDEAQVRSELNQLNLLSGFYDRIHAMRVVPFDLRSAGQLLGSAVGPLIPLVPYFVDLPEPWKQLFLALTKWIPGVK